MGVELNRVFDRLPRFDERSRAYGIRRAVANRAPASVLWACEPCLDQGEEGACVGFGIAHELACEPAVCNVDAKFAREGIYWPAQRIDEYRGGAYPGAYPRVEGTSLLAGLKTVKRLGACGWYEWAFGVDELALGLQVGPAVLGLTWFDGMMRPDKTGYVWPTGRKAGGHCILCRGIDLEKRAFILRNSWGKDWGIGGDCLVTWGVMNGLLDDSGEAAFLRDRHVIDMDTMTSHSRGSWFGRLFGWFK